MVGFHVANKLQAANLRQFSNFKGHCFFETFCIYVCVFCSISASD